jgi:predicted DNA-binding transcriptional regulator AlpA
MAKTSNAPERKAGYFAPDNQRPVLNIKETAAFLGVSESLIWVEIRRGSLKPLRIGDRVMFSRNYLNRLCDGE